MFPFLIYKNSPHFGRSNKNSFTVLNSILVCQIVFSYPNVKNSHKTDTKNMFKTTFFQEIDLQTKQTEYVKVEGSIMTTEHGESGH
jgi:hypothetical protein